MNENGVVFTLAMQQIALFAVSHLAYSLVWRDKADRAYP